ncbi:hypothetical protein J1N35_041228 [Gossypium stocksii]|uniref:Zinc finger PMZ-type domain-containing protein n=1 Tax=Gossypium stocksii TaxID=47602 RepID=A0A9D3UFG3_9ROSI|nr:hypothetical protein J1N35_041228 [Gossypium stocksii]
MEETYDCGRFQALRFPCAHTIAICGNIWTEYAPYINNVYRLQCIRSMWSPEFQHIPNVSMWLPVSSMPFELVPNNDLRRVSKGRPNSTQIRNSMDIWKRHDQ